MFHPATGQVQLHPVTRSTNAILHPWLKMTLEDVTARLPTITDPIDPGLNRTLWQVWQNGLTVRFTLPEDLPPLRVLLVWDNLAGHKTPEMVGWLCRHGIMPLYTPLGGSWLNMAEAIQRILKRRSMASTPPARPRSGLGSSRRRTPGTSGRHPSSGTASVGSAGATDPVMDTRLAAPPRSPYDRYLISAKPIRMPKLIPSDPLVRQSGAQSPARARARYRSVSDAPRGYRD